MAIWTCSKCDRRFGSNRSLQQHIRDSANHYSCYECGYISHTIKRLERHCLNEQHCWVCEGCMIFPTNATYQAHLDEENVCRDCGRHFDNENNLFMHSLTHRESTYECYGCYRCFTTIGGMLIHLESGNCTCEHDIYDLNQFVAEYDDADDFLRSSSLEEIEDRESPSEMPYFCYCCGKEFVRLSGLLQHAESPGCGVKIGDWRMAGLLEWLEKRYRPGWSSWFS